MTSRPRPAPRASAARPVEGLPAANSSVNPLWSRTPLERDDCRQNAMDIARTPAPSTLRTQPDRAGRPHSPLALTCPLAARASLASYPNASARPPTRFGVLARRSHAQDPSVRGYVSTLARLPKERPKRSLWVRRDYLCGASPLPVPVGLPSLVHNPDRRFMALRSLNLPVHLDHTTQHALANTSLVDLSVFLRSL